MFPLEVQVQGRVTRVCFAANFAALYSLGLLPSSPEIVPLLIHYLIQCQPSYAARLISFQRWRVNILIRFIIFELHCRVFLLNVGFLDDTFGSPDGPRRRLSLVL